MKRHVVCPGAISGRKYQDAFVDMRFRKFTERMAEKIKAAFRWRGVITTAGVKRARKLWRENAV